MPADINSPVRVAYKNFPEKLVNHSDHDWVNWREADMNTRWIILVSSIFHLLLLNNQAEAYSKSKPVGKRRFLLERIVQVIGCYWGQKGWVLWKFVKMKFSFFLLQHQDPRLKSSVPTKKSYIQSSAVGREVRQIEVSWCFNYDDI